MIASSNAQWQNGDILPEIKELFPDTPIIGRTGIINAYEDPTFRTAFKKIVAETDRTQIILAGVTIGTCTLFPALSLQNDGYVSTFAFACELQEDWKKPWANAMLEPFKENLSEYGYVMQNFWDNYGQKIVPDPFA
jgi:hypothetical protein